VKRVLIVLFALVATPFLVGASQGQGHDAAHCAKRAAQHPGKEINKCDAPPTDPPPGPQPTPQPSCVASALGPTGSRIDGMVYNDASTGRTALANWCVQLTGTVTASALTDLSGNYFFAGLPDGDYTVCEDLQTGWVQTFPQSSWGAACPGGFGWSFSLSGGTGAGWVNFGNVKP
jgi:hypothetical protein